jgi:ABC-2 type transport system ATP-binding protein
MSTHILADVERVCDTVGIINRGKLVTEAPREALLAQYAVPALEVEVDEKSEVKINPWSESLKREPWVKTISRQELVVRIIVNDIETAKTELLRSAAQAGMVLNKYEVVKPSLEDVFLQLVSEEEAEK